MLLYRAIFNLLVGCACLLGFMLFRWLGVQFYESRIVSLQLLSIPLSMTLIYHLLHAQSIQTTSRQLCSASGQHCREGKL